MSNSREKVILEVAQEMVRQGGYNNFSFRNIASAVGIKSSSVHYHFSTKEDLGVAVAKYYTNKFLVALGDPADIIAAKKNPISSYINAFRTALEEDKGMCLCGILGAEAEILPTRVIAETRLFFQRNIEWLENAYRLKGINKKKARENAIQVISLLEGAMIMSNVIDDLNIFDSAVKIIKQI